jgi:hypothetical protein
MSPLPRISVFAILDAVDACGDAGHWDNRGQIGPAD